MNFLRYLGLSPKPKRTRAAVPYVSDPKLLELWLQLHQEFFPDQPELSTYIISWSRRPQRRVLASVSLRKKVVRVAKELNRPDLSRWLEPLLYHEMCHAVLGEDIPKRRMKRMWHGAEFKQLEKLHPHIIELDQWIKDGGWRNAVLSARARASWSKRKRANG